MWLVKIGTQNPVNQRRSSTKFVICVGVIFVALLCNSLTAAARKGCSNVLGLESKKIQDWQLTSFSNDNGYEARNARLNNNGAWCSDSEKKWTEYLQIRLDRVRHISGIASQGYKMFFGSYWVKQYSLKYSYDGSKWYWYKDGTRIKDFSANSDPSSVKMVNLRDTFVAKYLRIYPTSYKDDMCMRLELYGCPNNIDCTTMVSASSGVISTPNHPSPYPSGMDCTWIFNLPDKSKQIKAFFNYFDVNNGLSEGCQGDYVQVLDGPSDNSLSLGRFCNGVDLPLLTSSASAMRVHFHSEADSTPSQGFQLSYSSGEIKRTAACTGSKLTLSCLLSDKTIKIVYAAYGSLPFSSICGSLVSSSSCNSANSQQAIESKCEHFKTCNMDVSKAVFDGMSCAPGKVPQLVVYYQCTGTVIRTTPAPTTAPSTTATFTPPDHTILITTAPSQAPPLTTKPAVISTTEMVQSVKTDVETTPSVGATQDDKGNKLARESKKDKNGLMIGIVVAVIAVIVIVVIILVCFAYQRRRRQKEKPAGGVVYTAPCNSFTAPAPRPSNPGHTSSRGNAYETVNVLYVSADDPRNYCDEEQEHIYDSPDLQEPLPKMTNNPLYHGFDDPHPNSTSYEQIDKDRPPPSLDPAIYDSPLPVTSSPSKSATGRSIANPSYDKGVVEILQTGK